MSFCQTDRQKRARHGDDERHRGLSGGGLVRAQRPEHGERGERPIHTFLEPLGALRLVTAGVVDRLSVDPDRGAAVEAAAAP
jgi:hypothetical protein